MRYTTGSTTRAPARLAPLALSLLLVACAGGTGEAAPPEADPAAEEPAAPPAATERSLPPDTLEDEEAANRGSARSQEVVDLGGVGHDFGSPDAPVRVVEMMDFGCHHCRTFHEQTFPALRDEYVETGRVFWKVVPFVLGSFPNSPAAAVAAECAGRQGRFDEMSDRLFAAQREWIRTDNPVAAVRGYARSLGLDATDFDACLSDPGAADRIRAHGEIARRLGVRGTPTFFVLGHFQVPGAVPLDLFRDILDRALEAP